MFLGHDIEMDDSVGLTTLLDGFSQTQKRFKDACKGTDKDAAFLALFEVLNWAASIDDYMRRNWRPEGKPLGLEWSSRFDTECDGVVRGARFARNRVHHQWARALQYKPGGLQFPVEAPFVFHEWCWLPVESLPPSDRNQDFGIEQYDSHLSGRPIRFTLSVLKRVYGTAQENS